MTEYEKGLDAQVAYCADEVKMPLARVISACGLRTNLEPLYLVVPQLTQVQLRADGVLADVAPTILQVMGIAQPAEMTGRSLLIKGQSNVLT